MRKYILFFVLTVWYGLVEAQTDSVQKVVAGRSNSPEQLQKPYVILISADGFRWDLAERYHATNLLQLQSRGIAAERMIPSYPSVTFPNHYTLATGMYPSHHGLVDNTFYDAKKDREYRINDRSVVQDGSWYGGTPIWNLAEGQGMLSASFFWVGSEAAVGGVRPTYYYIFNDKIPLDSRLQTVKGWLQLPEAQRPHLILFYLSQVDHAAHYHGPESRETEEAVHLVDDCIGKMTRIVDSLHLPVNYIFVSDHGMGTVDTVKGGLELPRSIDTTKFRVAGAETLLHLYARDKKDVPAQYQALKKENPDGFEIYLPDETPARWHYMSKDDRYSRMGDIILVTKYPRMMYLSKHRLLPGMHGFDNAIREMGASFYAWGPAFKQGVKIAPFENVNVYPLVAQILGLKAPADIDGRMEVLGGVLK